MLKFDITFILMSYDFNVEKLVTDRIIIKLN